MNLKIISRQKDRTANPTLYGKPKRTPTENNFRSVSLDRSLMIKIGSKVMPAINLDHIVDTIKEYDSGKYTAVSVHAITNSTYRSISYTKRRTNVL